MPVSIDVQQVKGKLILATATLTRPNDTTAYAAGDVVSNSASATTPLALPLARVEGGSGYLVAARLSTSKKSITPRMRVHLFNASDPTLAADNAAWRELFADASKRLGYFDLPAMSTAADTTNSNMARALDLALRIPFVAAAAALNLYAVLETLDAFTPDANQQFSLTLLADVD